MDQFTHLFCQDKSEWWKQANPLTIWQNKNTPTGRAVNMSYAEFFRHMDEPKRFNAKGELPGWSPVVFKDNHRKLENAFYSTAIVLDFEPPKGSDEPGASLDMIQQSWGWTGHLIYASWSHQLTKKEGGPRRNCFRMILPLTDSVTPEEYTKIVLWAGRLYPDLPIDLSAKDASRLWYAPALRPDLDRLEIGTCWVEQLLCPSKILSSLPVEPEPVKPSYQPYKVETSGPHLAYVQAALDKATKAIFDCPEGNRNNTLNREAYSIGGLVGAGVITEAQARDCLLGATRAAGWKLPLKNEATFNRGLAAGRAEPRSLPNKITIQSGRDTWELQQETQGPSNDDGNSPALEDGGDGAPPLPPDDGSDAPPDDDGELPEVRLGPDRVRVLDETLEFLGRSRCLYQRSCELVEPIFEWIATNGSEKRRANAQIRSIHPARLEELMTRSINFQAWSKVEKDFAPTNPPRWLVDQIHKRATWDTIKPLRGVVETPVLRPDGTLICEPGYDEQTGLIYRPNTKFDPIDTRPTSEAVQQSLARLFSLVKDFPFESRAHRSAWLASLLTVLCRPAFNGPAPLFLIDSNVRGAGKTKLVHLIGQIVLGSSVEAMANVNDDVEMEKRILGIAKAGYPITMIDDISGVFGTASLNNALTSTRFRGRTLGVTDLSAYDLLTVWFATGNNIQLFRDLARRCCHIRLLSEEQHPEYRNLPDILGEVSNNRSTYLNSALTLIVGWFNAGRPKAQVKSWGSFEGWSSLIRQIVLWCGEPDPGDTREGLVENADVEAIALANLLSGWVFVQDRLSCPDGVTIKQVLDEIDARKNIDEELRGLEEAIRTLCPNATDRQLPTKLAQRLAHLKDRVVQGKAITHGARSKGGILWTVQFAKRRTWDAEQPCKVEEPASAS